MSFKIPFLSSLDFLKKIYPIYGVLNIGAGTGRSIDIYKKLGAPIAAFIEADKKRFKKLSNNIDDVPGWMAYQKIISSDDQNAIFYLANNLNESGLISPKSLNPLWPNLQILEQEDQPTESIKTFLENNKETLKSSQINWLHIECFPSLSILHGAAEYLDQFDVVITRVILNETLMVDQQQLGSCALDAFMTSYDFIRLSHEKERHSAIGQVLYVRNMKNQLSKQIEKEQLKSQEKKTAFKAEIAHLSKLYNEQISLADHRQIEIIKLPQNQNNQQNKVKEFTEKIALLTKQRDEQKQLITETQAELVETKQNADRLEKLKLLRENDLEDLRLKYKALKELYDSQQTVLQKLQSKLLLVSEYFQRLQEEKGDVDEN